MYVEVIRGLLFLLMPQFPKIPPSVDSSLWGKRPIKGSVTHLPPHTHTQTYIHFLFPLFLLSHTHTWTHRSAFSCPVNEVKKE